MLTWHAGNVQGPAACSPPSSIQRLQSTRSRRPTPEWRESQGRKRQQHSVRLALVALQSNTPLFLFQTICIRICILFAPHIGQYNAVYSMYISCICISHKYSGVPVVPTRANEYCVCVYLGAQPTVGTRTIIMQEDAQPPVCRGEGRCPASHLGCVR